MQLTVEEALNLDILKGSRVLAGEQGLKKTINCVDIIEVPDVEGWLKEGGFYLTTGYTIKDNESAQKNLIKHIAKANSAGLGIKKGRYFDKIPEVMIEMADELKLPLIEIPRDIPYADILSSLLSEILERQAYLLRQSERIHKELTQVVLKGGGIELLAQTLHKLISRTVVIQDEKGQLLAVVGDEKEEKKIRDYLDIPREELLAEFTMTKKPLRIDTSDKEYTRIIAPVFVSGKIFGFVSIFEVRGKKLKNIDFRAVEHASTVIALEMLKEGKKVETEKRLKAELLEDLLGGFYHSKQSIIQRARYLGWDLERDYLVMVVDIDNLEDYYLNLKNRDENHIQAIKERIKDIVKHNLVLLNKKVILANRSDSLVIFFDCEGLDSPQERKEESIKFARLIREQISRDVSQISVSIGIGNFFPDVSGLKKSFQQAKKAEKVGRKVFGEGQVYHYDDLGVYRLLVKLRDDPDLQSFYREMLGPLLNYESQGEGELLKTLKTLFKHFGNKTRAAEELCIHRNSLNYRIERIKEILNVDLKEPENWFELYLACKIYEMFK